MKALGINLSLGKNKSIAPVNLNTGNQPKNGRNNDDAIILQIAKSFQDKSRKDIDKWRKSLLAAENPERPRFTMWADLIDDLKREGTLQLNMMLRKAATMSVGYNIRNKKTGEINELATDLFRQRWFFRYMNQHLDAIVYGGRVLEFLNFNGHRIKFKLIPPRNVVTTEKRVYFDVSNDTKFAQYDDPIYEPWLVEFNDDSPFGLIDSIVPNIIWLRNVFQSWMEFCEKFGQPLVSATTNNNDSNHLDRVERQLLALAEASVGVFPEGTTVKFDEANRTDACNVFDKFIERNVNIVAGIIVGSSTLSSDSANRAQTEVHERSLDYKISQSDRRDIAFTVNDDLLPILKKQGYTYISDDDIFEWIESKEEIDLVQYWSIVQGLLQEYDIEEDWLASTFNVPITGKKKSMALTPQVIEEPKATATWQAPDYPTADCCPVHRHAIPVAEARSRIIDQLTERLMQQLWDGGELLGIQGEMITQEALQLFNGLQEGYGTTVAYNTPDTLALQLMEYNLFEFSASKTEARLAAMTDILVDKDNLQIRSFSDFKRLASEKVKSFNEDWLRSEYNLSIAVGQTSAQYHRFISEKDSVTSFVQYQTAGDSKVRNQHARLEGKIFNLSDREAMKLWPPNGYGCRCEMIQYNRTPQPGQVTNGKAAQELIQESDPKWKDSQFAINRADLKEVFTREQFYSDVKGMPKKINAMTFEKYDLKKWSAFRNGLQGIELDSTITPANKDELFKPEGKEQFMGFKDYLGRKMMLTDKTFKVHTEGKYLKDDENRHQLFPHVKDVLDKPDEVWYNSPGKLQGKFQSRYIKFYNDTILVVDCDMAKDGLEIKTWYSGKIDEKELRRGLLVKKGKDL